MPWYEYVGIVASVLIVLSLVFKTSTYKGTILMRIVNIVGAAVFVAYGTCLVVLKQTGYATLITNIFCCLISIIYLIIETKSHKKSE